MRQRMRLAPQGTHALEAVAHRLDVFLVRAEAKVLQLLSSRRAMDRAPAMRIPEGVKIDAAVNAAHVEAELAVEARGYVEVGHGEREMIQRMNRGSGRPRGRLRCLRHGSPPRGIIAPAPDRAARRANVRSRRHDRQ